jgi:endoglycosylceramidase
MELVANSKFETYIASDDCTTVTSTTATTTTTTCPYGDPVVNKKGTNAFRISAAWAALQPDPPSSDGTITDDSSYLSALSDLVTKLADHGAFSLLDMHQDGLSPSYGSYDGIPQWLANLTEPRHAWPWPWKDDAPTDISEAAAQNFGEIYHNTHGGLDAWAAAWRSFAERFQHNPAVLGYELMNEPFAGDVYHDPTLFLPGVAGSKSLAPAYDVVADAIRSVDNTTMIFFEPVTWGMIHDSPKTIQKLISSGFDHVPGGDEYGDRSVFSFHYYCFFAKNGDGTTYPSMEKKACDEFLGPAVFDAVDETAKRLGSGSMMTEFGGSFFSPDSNTPNGRSTEEFNWLMDEADRRLQSWTFWDIAHYYNYPEPTPGCSDGLDCPGVKMLSRPYAQATAGTPTLMRFDTSSSVFAFSFDADASITAPTEIFLPPHSYPEGYSIEIEAANSAAWDVCEDRPNVICVSVASDCTVTLTVSPK